MIRIGRAFRLSCAIGKLQVFALNVQIAGRSGVQDCFSHAPFWSVRHLLVLGWLCNAINDEHLDETFRGF
jgi:hypothetical protein